MHIFTIFNFRNVLMYDLYLVPNNHIEKNPYCNIKIKS